MFILLFVLVEVKNKLKFEKCLVSDVWLKIYLRVMEKKEGYFKKLEMCETSLKRKRE